MRRLRALRGVVLLAAGHGLGAAVVLLKLPGGVHALWHRLVLQGMGLGMVMALLVFFVLAVLPVQHVGAAAGGLASMQQVGNSLGVADWRFFYATPVRQGYAAALCYPTLMALMVGCCTASWQGPNCDRKHLKKRRSDRVGSLGQARGRRPVWYGWHGHAGYRAAACGAQHTASVLCLGDATATWVTRDSRTFRGFVPFHFPLWLGHRGPCARLGAATPMLLQARAFTAHLPGISPRLGARPGRGRDRSKHSCHPENSIELASCASW
ncbi:hypothetical protein [Acidovorax delafieldii]|nr:hypothetical protein [Acidovorax delafieldii]